MDQASVGLYLVLHSPISSTAMLSSAHILAAALLLTGGSVNAASFKRAVDITVSLGRALMTRCKGGVND